MQRIDPPAPSLDYSAIHQYWDQATPSASGPYMMEGFGFPAGAGLYRFRRETEIVDSLLKDIARDGSVLDLGSGVGYWAEHFAHQFHSVVAVENSTRFYEALTQRCSRYENIEVTHGNVLDYQPQEQHSLVFLGGLLMYLDEADAVTLLRNLIRFLPSNGMILCRESNVSEGSLTLDGDYQVVYRSVETYQRIFKECGLSVVRQEVNAPYVLMQVGCELIKSWKRRFPEKLQCLPLVGKLVYWGLRLGSPVICRLLRILGINFPKLTNHFFLLRPTITHAQ